MEGWRDGIYVFGGNIDLIRSLAWISMDDSVCTGILMQHMYTSFSTFIQYWQASVTRPLSLPLFRVHYFMLSSLFTLFTSGT